MSWYRIKSKLGNGAVKVENEVITYIDNTYVAYKGQKFQMLKDFLEKHKMTIHKIGAESEPKKEETNKPPRRSKKLLSKKGNSPSNTLF